MAPWPWLADAAQRRKAPGQTGPTKGDGWQIDYGKKVDGGPLAIGFDESFIIPASLDMYPYVYLKNDKPTEWATVTKAFHRPGPSGEKFEAIDCLQTSPAKPASTSRPRQGQGQTVFLYLPLTSPHTPIVPAKRWQGKSGLGSYGDFLMETDWVVGEVLKALTATSWWKTRWSYSPLTTAAHLRPRSRPHQAGPQPNADWRGHKADIFEGATARRSSSAGRQGQARHRFPRPSAPPTCSPRSTTSLATAKTSGQRRRGFVPFLPALLPRDARARPFTIHHSINGSFAIRRGKWKLTLCPGSGGWSAPRPNNAKNPKLPLVQLHDLESDPAEKNNLQAKHTRNWWSSWLRP